jgi:hypothetical protein
MLITEENYLKLKFVTNPNLVAYQQNDLDAITPSSSQYNCAVFCLPDTAIEQLSKIIKRQLQTYKTDLSKSFPISLNAYIRAIHMLADAGYTAVSSIKQETHIFQRYHASVIDLFQSHAEFINSLSDAVIASIAKTVPCMINFGLIAFNLLGYPHYFAAFREAIEIMQHSLAMFEKDDAEISAAKNIFSKIFFYT